MTLRAMLLLGLLVPLAANARDWQVDPAKSTLGFQGSYQGEGFEGTFRKFAATIAYDPAALAASKFDVTVELGSADTGSSERDDTLKGSEFFATERFPRAHFVTSAFARGADGGVVAKGNLTIRDRTQPVTLHVRFTESGDSAILDVDTVLKRAEFALGNGSDWVDIGADIPVHGHLALTTK